MGRSWFYLTLWAGTPPAFTDETTVMIGASDQLLAPVETSTELAAMVETTETLTAPIHDSDQTEVYVITTEEVVWFVGGVFDKTSGSHNPVYEHPM